MDDADIARLAGLHFVLSPEVDQMLASGPQLLRQLATTTTREEEGSADRIRGSINWNRVFAARAATGIPHLYVTLPTRRAYQTPENQLLVFVLSRIAELARVSNWLIESGPAADTLRKHVADADMLRRVRMLSDVSAVRPSARIFQSIRAGRLARRYADVIAAYELHESVITRRDIRRLREVIEKRALVVADNAVVFELRCLFGAIEAATTAGWYPQGPLHLVEGSLRLICTKGDDQLEIWYQSVPPGLKLHSRYVHVQESHSLRAGVLRPDVCLRRSSGNRTSWLLIEAKMGEIEKGGRSAIKSARAALKDLLAYRRDYEQALDGQPMAYGLGVAWGAGLAPMPGEIKLCTPELLPAALQPFLA